MKKTIFTSIAIILLTTNIIFGQSIKHTISGHITDASTGEDIIGANIYIPITGEGTVSNVYGFYSITLPEDTYELQYSYIGLITKSITINLDRDITENVELAANTVILGDIVITAEEQDNNVSDIGMSKEIVQIDAVKKLPALFGEVDIIKAVQMIPGVKSIGEATSGFYVRGGNADQNLVLLDEAPIYNASHMLGFFSSFNPDAIKDMQIYKGAIPANYGGRLSSVLDIRMKEGNTKKFAGAMGIGTMMSRLTLEAPITKKGSFMVSGRRSYIGSLVKIQNAIKKKPKDDRKFYFYDLNTKINFKLNDKNRVFASGYFGRDVIKMPIADFNWGNITSTLRWNHVFSPKLFSNLSLYYSNYDYQIKVNEGIDNFTWASRLQEWSGKLDISYYLNPKNTIKFGLQSIKHDINPGDFTLHKKDEKNEHINIPKNISIENAAYINNDQTINDNLSIAYGFRLSSISNLGPYTSMILNDKYEVVDSIHYPKGSYNDNYNIEPRLGIRYKLNNSSSIKASYNRTAQYIQQASNGNTSTPLDIWFTSNNQVKPQLADQYTIGIFKNMSDNKWETSIEIYYKDFKNSIDFKERAQLLLNKNLEKELRSGIGKAYGLEFSIKKQKGRLTGQFGYTYSKVKKKIKTVNNDKWYAAKYDQPHNVSLLLSYELNNRWLISSNMVYTSGNAVTFPTGRYNYGGTIVPVYSERNGARLPHYHRMDLSVTRKSKKKLFNTFDSEWVFSIYNVYNRKNAYSVNFKQEVTNPNITYAEKTSVFGIVPSFTFNAKF